MKRLGGDPKHPFPLEEELQTEAAAATALVPPTPLCGGHGSGKKGVWPQNTKISLMYVCMYVCMHACMQCYVMLCYVMLCNVM